MISSDTPMRPKSIATVVDVFVSTAPASSLAAAAVIDASVDSGLISETAPTNVVLPTPKPPAMTIFADWVALRSMTSFMAFVSCVGACAAAGTERVWSSGHEVTITGVGAPNGSSAASMVSDVSTVWPALRLPAATISLTRTTAARKRDGQVGRHFGDRHRDGDQRPDPALVTVERHVARETDRSTRRRSSRWRARGSLRVCVHG